MVLQWHLSQNRTEITGKCKTGCLLTGCWGMGKEKQRQVRMSTMMVRMFLSWVLRTSIAGSLEIADIESLENQWQTYTGKYSVGSQEQFNVVNGRPDGEYLRGACSYRETWLVTAGAGAQNSGDCDLVIVLNGDCDESLTLLLWRTFLASLFLRV